MSPTDRMSRKAGRRHDRDRRTPGTPRLLLPRWLFGGQPFDFAEQQQKLVDALFRFTRRVGVGDGQQPVGGRVQGVARRWPVAVIAAAGLGVLVTVAVPESSRSQAKVESRHQVEGFRCNISLAPRDRAKRFRRRSASADSLGP